MLVVKRLALALICLLLMGQSTMSPSGGIIVPPSGLVVPVTPSSIGAAGIMPAACPNGQALTHITDTTYTCQPFEGGSGSIPSGVVNQLLGYDPSGNPESQTIGGGNGNCIYTRTNLQYGSITCANYATFGGGTFTGTVAAPIFYMTGLGLVGGPNTGISLGGLATRANSINIPTNGQILFNDAPLNFTNIAGTATDAQIGPNYSGIGACTSGAFVTALQRNSTPICLTPGPYAPLTNPTGGQNNYASLFSPSFTGVVTLNDATGGMMGVAGAGIALGGSILRPNSINLPAGGQYLINDVPISGGGGGGAPLVNPAGGQNNYAPIDVPVFTGATFTLLQPSQGILFQGGTSITGSITNQGTASNFLGMTSGVHYNGSTYVLDATTPNGIVMNGQIGLYGGSGTIGSTWSPLSIGTFSNTGLAMGAGLSITTPNLTVSGAGGLIANGGNLNGTYSFQDGGSWGPNGLTAYRIGANILPTTSWPAGGLQASSIGIGQTPAAPVSQGLCLLCGTYNSNSAATYTLTNSTAGTNAYSIFYLYNDIPHYAALQLGSSTSTLSGFPPDSLVLGTNATNGISINSAAGGNINFWAANLEGTINDSGMNLTAGRSYQQNGNPLSSNHAWTPQAAFGGTNVATTNFASGYTWIGNQVTAYFGVGFGGGPGGNLTICGLPVSVAGGTNQGVWPLLNFGGTTAMPGPVGAYISGGSGTCLQICAIEPTGCVSLTSGNIAGTANIQGTVTYVANSYYGGATASQGGPPPPPSGPKPVPKK